MVRQDTHALVREPWHHSQAWKLCWRPLRTYARWAQQTKERWNARGCPPLAVRLSCKLNFMNEDITSLASRKRDYLRQNHGSGHIIWSSQVARLSRVPLASSVG